MNIDIIAMKSNADKTVWENLMNIDIIAIKSIADKTVWEN